MSHSLVAKKEEANNGNISEKILKNVGQKKEGKDDNISEKNLQNGSKKEPSTAFIYVKNEETNNGSFDDKPKQA